jgi:hypothetical protein
MKKHHPVSRFDRLVLRDKKELEPNEQKKNKKNRSGRVHVRLERERAKEQETEDDIKEFLRAKG